MRKVLNLLFASQGVVSGRAYLYSGALLFLLKYAIDALVVRTWFGRTWMPWDYLNIQWRDIDFQNLNVVRFATILLVIALPFIWCGVVMTLKRIRTIGWNGGLVLFFFVPFLNIPFLLLLAFWPDPKTVPIEPARREFGAALVMILVVTSLAVACVALATVLLEHYGWGLFVGIPFLIGFIPGLLHQTSSSRPLLECVVVGAGLQLFVGAALIMFALEGLICLIMVAPIAITLNAFGAFIGYNLRRAMDWNRRQREVFCAGAYLLLPLMLFAEKSAAPSPSLIAVKTVVDISAPREVVWNHVVTFSELPPPTEWIFHAGVAHPLKAEINGSGVGAIRHCVFSTGAFVEPIEVWDEPRLLQFSVTKNPPSMREISYHDIKPAHLDGFLRSERGQFELKPLPGGATRLEGTTWYRHGLWPERYWQLWSDHIIHTIHLRVLRHIKSEAEAAYQKQSIGTGN